MRILRRSFAPAVLLIGIFSLGVPAAALVNVPLARAAGASLYVSPASGGFTVGSTFTASIYVDTGGEAVNAVEADLSFDPRELQVVSPSSGKSFFEEWISQPTYSNTAGTLSFAGAIPNPGIVTSAGLVSTVTFRVVGTGTGTLKFLDTSKVLLNNGQGTDVLGNTSDGIYSLAPAPPEGPIVTSPTNPDQNKWYDVSQVVFEWAAVPGASGYGYMMSDNSVDDPPDVLSGTRTSADYAGLSDGMHYFHIKALKNGVWGGVTNFAVRVDQAPPAAFDVQISPSEYTTNQDPVIQFGTTDPVSGIDHYEIKVIPLDLGASEAALTNHSFFTETNSPYLEHFPLGRYAIVVRAVNGAGNYTQETADLTVVPPIVQIVGSNGILINQAFTLSWPWVFVIALLLIFLLSASLAREIVKHRDIEARLAKGAAANPEIAAKLAELRQKRKEYEEALKRLSAVVLAVASVAGLLGLFAAPKRVFAASGAGQAAAATQGDGLSLNPPVINLYPSSLGNDEVLYLGGWANVPNATVKVYIEQTATGNTYSGTATTGSDGNWFYSSPELLPAGDYAAWAELTAGQVASPPSGRVDITISPTAIQIGSARLDYAQLYLILLVLVITVAAVLLLLLVAYGRRTRRKKLALEEAIRVAEESLRRGFTLLQRDIEAELAGVRALKLRGASSDAERAHEEKLLRDLDSVKRYIGKEIWFIEQEEEK